MSSDTEKYVFCSTARPLKNTIAIYPDGQVVIQKKYSYRTSELPVEVEQVVLELPDIPIFSAIDRSWKVWCPNSEGSHHQVIEFNMPSSEESGSLSFKPLKSNGETEMKLVNLQLENGSIVRGILLEEDSKWVTLIRDPILSEVGTDESTSEVALIRYSKRHIAIMQKAVDIKDLKQACKMYVTIYLGPSRKRSTEGRPLPESEGIELPEPDSLHRREKVRVMVEYRPEGLDVATQATIAINTSLFRTGFRDLSISPGRSSKELEKFVFLGPEGLRTYLSTTYIFVGSTSFAIDNEMGMDLESNAIVLSGDQIYSAYSTSRIHNKTWGSKQVEVAPSYAQSARGIESESFVGEGSLSEEPGAPAALKGMRIPVRMQTNIRSIPCGHSSHLFSYPCGLLTVVKMVDCGYSDFVEEMIERVVILHSLAENSIIIKGTRVAFAQESIRGHFEKDTGDGDARDTNMGESVIHKTIIGTISAHGEDNGDEKKERGEGGEEEEHKSVSPPSPEPGEFSPTEFATLSIGRSCTVYSSYRIHSKVRESSEFESTTDYTRTVTISNIISYENPGVVVRIRLRQNERVLRDNIEELLEKGLVTGPIKEETLEDTDVHPFQDISPESSYYWEGRGHTKLYYLPPLKAQKTIRIILHTELVVRNRV